MSNKNRWMAIVGMIITIVGLIIYYQANVQWRDLTAAEIETINNKQFGTKEQAVNHIKSVLFDKKDNIIYEIPLVNQNKEDITVVGGESINGENKNSEFKTIIYLVKKDGHYFTRVRDTNFKLQDGMKPMRDKVKLGDTIAEYYIGPLKDNPFKEEARIITDSKKTGIVFHLE